MPLPPSLHYLRALLFRNLPSFRSVRFFAYGVANIFCLWHFISQYVGNYPLTWGPSMLPTLAARGDIVWVSSYYRHGRGIEVGDVVSFKHPCVPEAAAVKRVAGMPGDFVMRDVYEGGGGKGMGMMLQVNLVKLYEGGMGDADGGNDRCQKGIVGCLGIT